MKQIIKWMLTGQRRWPSIPFERMKSRARILVIDDQDFPYETLFDRDNYNITKWDDVKSLEPLERGDYDVILLDIQGVGREYSEEQGLGILRHIRKANPTQIVVAYSGDDYKLDKQPFFQMADAALGKSQDYTDFKSCVDQQIKRAHSIEFFIQKIHELAGSEIDQDILEKEARRAILSGRQDRMRKLLQRNLDNQNTIGLILQVVSAGAAVVTAM